ncbi:hypothetical protein DER44DRAFT_678013 [Fusarium oxysporum]|nr:hypothetical protein DER44DRAFT_678013 [Fusarium oxysporum]
MALMHRQNGDQASYKVLQWLQRDGDALLSEASLPSNFSTSNSPSSKPLATTSTSNISESETTEYSNVPSEWFECFTLEGRQVPKHVSGAWEPIDEPAWKSSRLFEKTNGSSHQLWWAINDNRLYYSPVHRPQLVADIGCGTCTWSMDFVELNPDSHVIAVDKSPFMPTYVQPNVETILGDLCLDLPFNGGTADLVFFRQLTVSQCGLNLTDLRHFDIQGQIMLPLHEGLELPLAEIERLAVGMRRELSEDMEFETFTVYAQKPPETITTGVL